MLSRELEETLRRAMSTASSHSHEFATLEHLLLALTEDSDALEVLSACKVDIEELRTRLSRISSRTSLPRSSAPTDRWMCSRQPASSA